MLDRLFLVRHGFRMSSTLWVGSTTGLERDPPLTAHGVEQIRHLAAHVAALPPAERPELVISSPYQRCVNSAAPLAHALCARLCAEPGLGEWYPPLSSGARHPAPPSAAHLADERVCGAWTPLLYPPPRGESIDGLRARMHEVLRRIEARCAAWGVRRVVLVAHAATNIALAQVLLAGGVRGAAAHAVHAATASTTEFVRTPRGWACVRNGDTAYLPDGSEREWDFSFLPDNPTEPGMPPEWDDPHAPADVSLVFVSKL